MRFWLDFPGTKALQHWCGAIQEQRGAFDPRECNRSHFTAIDVTCGGFRTREVCTGGRRRDILAAALSNRQCKHS